MAASLSSAQRALNCELRVPVPAISELADLRQLPPTSEPQFSFCKMRRLQDSDPPRCHLRADVLPLALLPPAPDHLSPASLRPLQEGREKRGGEGRPRIYLAGRARDACARPDRSAAPSLPGIPPSPSSPLPCTSGSLALPVRSRRRCCRRRLARRGSATGAGAEGLLVRPPPLPRSGPGAPSSAAEEPPPRLKEGGGAGLREPGGSRGG